VKGQAIKASGVGVISPAGQLTVQNRQRTRRVDVHLLRQIMASLVGDLLKLEQVELGVSLVGAKEMARINWQFLQHEGATDVITFDHTEGQLSRRKSAVVQQKINGELFVCVAVAQAQAQSFRTTWQSELVRYIVHGVLHLLGHDDHRPAARTRMKHVENRLMRLLSRRFKLAELGRNARG
jgi:probable rRNA maturation factor